MGIEVTILPTRSTPYSNLDWAALLVAKKKEKRKREGKQMSNAFRELD
jgi:hypothetical protein